MLEVGATEETFTTITDRPHYWSTFSKGGVMVDYFLFVLILMMFFVGLICNSLVLHTFQSNAYRSGKVLFSHLCVTDILTELTQAPTAMFILMHHRYVQDIAASSILCLLSGFMFDVLTLTSLFLTAVCCVDRTLALTTPIKYKNLMSKNITISAATGSWLLSAAVISSFVVSFVIEEEEWKVYKNYSNLALCDPQYLWKDPIRTKNSLLPRVIKSILASITGILVVFICISNVVVVVVLRQRSQRALSTVRIASRKKHHKSDRKRRETEVSQTTIVDDAAAQPAKTTAYLTNLQLHSEQCNRIKMKDKVATESVVILGSYFTVTFGSFIVLQYYMPSGFYLVRSETKYNTLLLIQLLLLLNSTLNPLVHYWRNSKIRNMVNGLVQDICRALFTGPFQSVSRNNNGNITEAAARVSTSKNNNNKRWTVTDIRG